MDKSKGELRLSFAAFIYYTNKKKYLFQRHSDDGGYISFWYDKDRAQHHIFQIITDIEEYDCGYVVINSEDVLNELFKDVNKDDDYDDFIENLNLCKKEFGPRNGETVLLHCNILPSERKNIKTITNTGEIIKCLNKNKP